MRSAVLAAGILLAMSLPAAADIRELVPPGPSDGLIARHLDYTCERWTAARRAGAATIFQEYVIGVLDGLSFGTGLDFWTAFTEWQWLDKYCEQNPRERLLDGAITMFKNQTGWRGWREPKP
jgi:hypothetical protein